MKIDLEKLRDALPEGAQVNLIKYRGKSPAIECKVSPSIHWSKHDETIEAQRQIIGSENILEFYTEETGHHWYVFLKMQNEPIEVSF